jgi:hypothetical protein
MCRVAKQKLTSSTQTILITRQMPEEVELVVIPAGIVADMEVIQADGNLAKRRCVI